MHQTDVGGKTPGSMPADATEIFQEGFRVPVQRLFTRDGFNEPVLNILLANSRTPTSFRGDLSAQVAGTRLGIQRMGEAVARFGKQRFIAHARAYVDYSERRVRDRLRRLHSGSYCAERRVDGPDYDSEDLGITVRADVVIDDGHVSVDFSRSSEQVPRPLNCVWAPRTTPGEEPRILVDNSLTGGTGARYGANGMDAVDNTVTNAMNYPAEMLEQEYPAIVERHELRDGSGGRGEFHGGLGMRRVLRFLAPGNLALRGHRHQYPPPGLAGGEPGAPSRFSLERDGMVQALSPQSSAIATEVGDRFIAETPDGGGFGPVGERHHPDNQTDAKAQDD